MENKVVKCNVCGQYFMHTEKALKCPFCRTEYVEVQEKTVGEKPASSVPLRQGVSVASEASDFAKASTDKKEKKEATKTQKESFKIWGKE